LIFTTSFIVPPAARTAASTFLKTCSTWAAKSPSPTSLSSVSCGTCPAISTIFPLVTSATCE
jgi:hypothetical protein